MCAHDDLVWIAACLAHVEIFFAGFTAVAEGNDNVPFVDCLGRRGWP